jgi:hypothetical protein
MIRNQRKLKASALAFIKAEDEYRQVFDNYMKTVEPINEADFWLMVGDFRTLIYRNKHKDECVKLAAREMFRKVLVGESLYKIDDLLGFVVAYARHVRGFYDALFCKDGIDLDRSDDGCSDLFDSLVLAGKKVYQDAQAGKLTFVDETLPEYLDLAGIPKWFKKFILEGENYCHMRLCDYAEEYVRAHIRELAKINY